MASSTRFKMIPFTGLPIPRFRPPLTARPEARGQRPIASQDRVGQARTSNSAVFRSGPLGDCGPMSRLLVVHHSPTRSLQSLTEAVVTGAHDDAIEGVEVVVKEALDFARGEAGHQDLLDADGYVLGTTANFGYMSGAMKHVFDSTFLQVGGALAADGSGQESAGATAKRPFGLYVHGRYDTTGAVRSVLSITGALGWRQGYDVLEAMGEVTLSLIHISEPTRRTPISYAV